MNRMIKRLLAAVLITSMLLGSNGISYAAEIADGDSIAGTEEVTQEAVDEEQVESPGDAEASEPANEESAEEVQTQEEAGEGQEADAQTVEEADADASEEENTAAEEEISEAASEEETVESEDEDAAVTEEAAAAEDAEAPENADAAAAELTAEEAAAAAAAAQAQEEVFTAGELVYHGHDYDVTLAYDENAKIPAAAELKVREIEKGTSEYESYLAGAEAAAGKGVAEARFFDITIVAAGTDGQQQEIQPQSQVRVNITYHKALEVAAEGEVQAMHFEDGTADAEVVNTDTNGGSEVSEIAFDAESFSVYGIVYTVDFTYDGFTYCIEGGSSIYLSELAQILGLYETDLDKAFYVGNVSNVTFTDYDLVKIEKQADGDWLLISLAPFTSEETLTIEMNDGVKFIVDVTDNVEESSDLTNFVKNVIISGATQNSDGSYNVERGKDYSITIAFAESSVYQFENDATLTYTIPQGITVLHEQSGLMTINIMAGGRTYQVGASYHLGTDGNLEIEFDQNDPYYSKLVSSTNVSFRFEYYAEFDGSSHNIKFSEEVERDIVFEEEKPGQAFVSKTATYDENTGRFNYTIKVTADGDVQNVNVKDIISGNALIFNKDVAITGKSEDHYTGSVTDNGFEYTFDSMSEDDVITITYSANVNFGMDGDKDGKITADQTNNTVTVTPEDGEPHSSNYSHEITFKSTAKSGGVDVDTTEDGDKILEWTITYNPLAVASAANDTITDTISADSVDYMKYYGDGIIVEVYDKNGNRVDTREVRYDQLTEHSDSSWKYTIPDTDTTPYKYVIKYKTVVDQSKVDGPGIAVIVNNDANGSNGSATVGPSNEVGITKDVESASTDEVTWISEILVPKTGLTKAEVTDTLPNIGTEHIYGPDVHGYVIDEYVENSLEISELLEGESYTVEYRTKDNGQKELFIVFYQDSNKTTPGLQASSSDRSIIVKLKSKVDQDWLKAGYKAGNWIQTHTNTIGINGKTDTADVVFGKPGVVKDGVVFKSDASGKPQSFKYSIVISGDVSEPLTIEDTFDTSLLELDQSAFNNDWNQNQMYIRGGNQYSQDYGITPVSYTESDTGLTITANTLPKQSNGEFYSHYKITYILKLKDGVDLDKLAQQNGGRFDLTNRVKWGDYEDDFTYETVYDYLDKQLLNAGQLGDTNRKAKYRIVFNSAKATLNNGKSMTMTDILSTTLGLDYTSINIVTDPEGESVPYSVSRDDETQELIATYTVPDATKVTITYDANVIGNGSVKITNHVHILDEDETPELTREYGSASEGQGAVAGFTIVKCDGYDANKKLEGVKFKIFAEDPDIDFGDECGNLKEIILTTDENGKIVLNGDIELPNHYQFFFGKRYHIQEVEAPADYADIGFDYLVTLTDDMALVDHSDGHWIYYFNDTMQIKNWPLEGLVVEKKVQSTAQADLDRLYKFRVSILNDDGSVNTDYNEKNGDDQFVNGAVEFELKNGENKMFWGFTKGTKYKVEEIDNGGLATTVSYKIFDEEGSVTETKTDPGTTHSGELTQDNEAVLFTNTKTEVGALKLTKEVTVNGAEPAEADKKLADGDYTFTITGAGSDGTVSKTVEITFENGAVKSATIDETEAQLDADGYVVIGGLTPGEYTITETVPTNGTKISKINGEATTEYSTKVTVAAGDTAAAEASATFTNDIGYGSLKITKNVTVNGEATTGTEADGTYEFTIVDSEGNAAKKIDGTAVGMIQITITNGAAGMAEVTKLAPGSYTITETDPTNGTSPVDGKNRTVTVEAGKSGNNVADAGIGTFTNNKGLGALKLTKEVTVNGAEPAEADKKLADGTYNFTITGPGSVSKTVAITVTDGKAVSAKVEGTATELTDGYVVIGGLTPGEYTITETVPTNGTKISKINGEATTEYSTKVTVFAGDTAAAQASATFTNDIGYGSLKITKNVTVNGEATTGTEADGTYKFTIVDSEGTAAKKIDGTEVGTIEITITNGVAGTTEVTKLAPGSYTITETEPTNGTSPVGGYSKTVTVEAGKSGQDVSEPAKASFTNNIDVVDIEVEKVWVNADGSEDWPEGVTVNIQLTADGHSVVGRTATLSAENPSHKFENLPKYQSDGTTEIEYSVNEVDVAGYESYVGNIIDGKITVTNEQETTEIEVDKKWVNADGSDTWPDGVTIDIQLTVGDTPVTGKTATLSADQPSYKFEKLPKYNSNGNEIEYSVVESNVPGGYSGFAEAVADGKITITNTQGVTQIEVEKKWVNADGTDTWPTGVTVEIQLTADGTEVSGKTATLSANQPSYKFEGLPMYQADGETKIDYSVKELEVTGYVSEVGETTTGRITVTNTQPATKIDVNKVWVNADGTDTWPTGVTVEIQLTADGTEVSGKTATLSADQPSYTFDKLPKYQADGTTEIAYSVKEVEVTGYTSEIGDLTDGKITVKNTQKTTEVEVEKKWVNADGTDTWPTGVTVEIQLTADGTEVSGKTATLSADQTSYTFDKLPKYKADGKTEIAYSVKEVEVAGYTSDVGDLTDGKITVTNTQETTEVEVEKKWINAEDQSVREWPEGVTVEIQLLADGTAVEGKKAKLSAEQPSYKFEKLPKYQSDGKTEIVYSIEEPTKIDGYTSSVEEKEARKFTVTNAYSATGTLNLEAEKKFKNGKLKEGEFTFELMDADGKVLQSKKNDAAGNVSFDMITYKLADVAKAPFTYTVREVPGSRTDVKYDTTVYTLTVELKDKGDGTLEVTKKIDNGGALKFENEQLNVETSVTIGGVKQLKGQTLKKDQFKFVLADENGKWLDTATNDAEGNFTFKPITYKLFDLNGEKTKVYSYSVWEVKGSESGITYDKTVYTVKVTVTDNGDGTMTAKADKAKSDIKFVNTTTEKKSKKTSSSKGSKTGDEAPLGVLFGGLGVGAIGLAVLLWNRKKKKDEE